MTALAPGPVTSAAHRTAPTGPRGVIVLQIVAVMLLVVPTGAKVTGLGANGTPAGVVAVLGLGLWIAMVLIGQHDPMRHRYPTRWTLITLWIVSLTSYIASQRRDRSPVEISGADRWILTMLALSGVILLASETIRTLDALLTLVRTLIWAGAFCGFVALVQFWFSYDLASQIATAIPGLTLDPSLGGIQLRGALNRVPGTTAHPIELGAVTAMLLPLAVAVGLIDIDRSWWRRALPVLLIAGGVPASVSRTAILAVLVAIAVFVVQVGPRLRLMALAAVPVGLVITFGAFPGLLRTLVNIVIGSGSDTSITTRTDDYQMVESLTRQRPLFGLGGGTWLPDDLLRILDNIYLTWLLEFGLVGIVVLIVWVMVLPVATAITVRRRARDPRVALLATALSASLASAAVSAATFDSLTFTTMTLLQAFLIGLVGAVWQLMRHLPNPATPRPANASHATTTALPEDQMDSLNLARALRRNLRLVLPTLLVTVLAAAAVAAFVPRTFTTTTSLLVVGPASAPTEGALESTPALRELRTDNPLTRAYDPTAVITLITLSVNSDAAQQAILGAGGSDDYTVSQRQTYGQQTPFITITSTGSSRSTAIRTDELVTAALNESLAAAQAAAAPSPDFLVTLSQIQSPATTRSTPIRLELLVLALGLMTVFVAVSWGDALRISRAERAGSGAAALAAVPGIDTVTPSPQPARPAAQRRPLGAPGAVSSH